MKNNEEIYGDVPNIPKGLKKGEIEDALETNPPKRSGKLKKVRHRIKEMCKLLTKQ